MFEDAIAPRSSRDDSYQLDTLQDPEAELTRLERQARVVRQLELAWLASLHLPKDATIADVGSGPGFMSEALAGLVPEGRVYAIDADAALVQSGRERLARQGSTRVRFVHASAELIPLEAGSVDVSYARFLFQHLPRPAAVLEEMMRVARPGGTVVIVDTDDSGLILHPEPEGLAALLAASAGAQARRGGDRHIGRKLKGLMDEAGLVEPRVQVIPFTSEMVGMEAFLDICLGFKSGIVSEGDLCSDAVRETLSAAARLVADPGAFGHALGYVAVGTVPE